MLLVQNMPGASSVTAANYVWGVAKPDGLTILAPHNNVYLGQLSGQKEVQFDLPKFQWIGSLENDDMMLFGRADASFKSMGDIVRAKEPPKCGSTGVGSSDYVMSKILEETIGAKVIHVTGYPGSSEIAIAMERGEVACMGLTISTFYGREPFLGWLKTKFVRFLAQSGRKRQPRVEEAPTIYELMDEYKTSATKRRVAEAMLQGGEWARPYMVAPGTPAERVAILRAAFDKAVKDPGASGRSPEASHGRHSYAGRATADDRQGSDEPTPRGSRTDQETIRSIKTAIRGGPTAFAGPSQSPGTVIRHAHCQPITPKSIVFRSRCFPPGSPESNFSPEGLLSRSHSEYVEGDSLVDMIKEDLVAERVAIDSYREIIAYLANNDPTTRRMLEGILAMEEEHADDLVSLLEKFGNK